MGVMKKVLTVVGATLGMLACGGDGADMAAQLLDDAGEMVSDAGQALQDAAEWVDGGSDAQAQDDAGSDAQVPVKPAAPAVLEAPCDQVRIVKRSSGETTERWAKVVVEQQAIRSVWLCGLGAKTSCGGDSCSGAEIPVTECQATLPQYAQGAVWVSCGPYSSLRVVSD